MNKSKKNQLIRTNAAIWAGGMLASFILPMIASSLTDGPAGFLNMMTHVFPLIIAMLLSNAAINKAIGEPAD